ncbi:hypothetical protein [Streptomyces griseoluteus]
MKAALLALAASAAGLLPARDDPSGQGPDAVRTASGRAASRTADLPGQRPDAAFAPTPLVDVEALAGALAGGPLIDLLADAVTRRQDERRAGIEAMAALVAQEPLTVTAQNGGN